MVKRQTILERIDKLKEYLNFLNSIKNYNKEQYINNAMVYGSTERFLHLSIESIIDICNHIISDLRYRKPENNRDVFIILFENSIIDKPLKDNLCNMAGFRNILVHDYLSLNRGMVYDIVQNNLQDIHTLIEILIEYI